MEPQSSLTTLTINGFRGFSNEQTVTFAQPNGAPGSGLTIIVGPNNSGKSSITEAITAVTQVGGTAPTFSEGKRNKAAGDRVRITISDIAGHTRILRTVDSGGSENVFEGSITQPPESQVFVLPSRRSFSPFFGKSVQERTQYITNAQKMQNTRTGQNDLSSRIFHINNTAGKRAEFEAVLLKVLDPLPNWTIEQTDQGNYYLKYSYGTHSHSSDGLGEGLLSVFYIVDALYDSTPGSVVVIDEPELSLHPQLQNKVRDLLIEYAKDRQIVISTHAPKFINWHAIAVGATIVRVTNGTDGIRVHQIDDAARETIAGFLRDINNPHVLGLDANEVFFLFDKVVLVEGQEDVLLYPNAMSSVGVQVNAPFYGWGVGGADKMRLMATILHSLGFTKVAGILDADKAGNIAPLQTEFPDYFFAVQPADDIRTKPTDLTKTALLTRDLTSVRPEFTAATIKLFNDINTYLA